MSNAFTANLEIIDELTSQFSTNSDQRKIAEVQRIYETMRLLVQEREGNIRQTIKDLSRGVADLEKEATPPEPPGAHEARVRNMAAEQARASQQVSAMRAGVGQMERDREGLMTQAQELQALRDEVESMLSQAEPEIRHRLSLFAHISRATFHFERLPHISGTVSDPAGSAGIKSFDIDPSKTSRFETANYLWSQMES